MNSLKTVHLNTLMINTDINTGLGNAKYKSCRKLRYELSAILLCCIQQQAVYQST